MLPINYASLIKEVILESMEEIDTGQDVMPQRHMASQIYSRVPGLDYVDIALAVTDGDDPPGNYPLRNVHVIARERAVASEGRIEVVIDG